MAQRLATAGKSSRSTGDAEAQSQVQTNSVAMSFAKTEESRELLKIADDVHGAQFPFGRPGMAKDRLALLQQAFIKTFSDADLIAEAKKPSSISVRGRADDGKTLSGLTISNPDGSTAEGYLAAESLVARRGGSLFVVC